MTIEELEARVVKLENTLNNFNIIGPGWSGNQNKWMLNPSQGEGGVGTGDSLSVDVSASAENQPNIPRGMSTKPPPGHPTAS